VFCTSYYWSPILGVDMDIITRLEAILIGVWKLQDNAYGVTINKSV